jgi:hypothetical protein
MDARRLGIGTDLPRAFLEAAVEGYLTDTEWDALGGDWLEQALDYAGEERKGVRGPLTPIRPRPTRQAARGHRDRLASITADAGPLYRLAHYLDQHGRLTRQEQLGPPSLWDALADHTVGIDNLTRLAKAARDRGLYRHAAALWTTAATLGSANAAQHLINHLREVSPSDTTRVARWVAAQVSLDDPAAVAVLLDTLRWAEADDAVATLLARDPARHASLDNPGGVADLLGLLSWIGADDAARALAHRAALHVSLGGSGTGRLLEALGEHAADDAVAALLARYPFVYLDFDPLGTVADRPVERMVDEYLLLEQLREAGADAAVRAASLERTRARRSPLAALEMGRTGPVRTMVCGGDLADGRPRLPNSQVKSGQHPCRDV